MKKPTCEYCGRCLSVCPSYKHFLVETMSPRARIDLARAVEKGEFTPGPRYAESIAGCLQCLACTEICGKGVDGAEAILAARLAQEAGERGHRPFGRRVEAWVTGKLLPRRSWLMAMVRLCSLVQGVLPAEKQGTVRHLPEALSVLGKRSLPVLSRVSLFDQVPEVIEVPEGIAPRGAVAIFSGCFGGVVNPSAALALIRRLSARGFTVHVPRAQSCCGAPALLSGFGQAFAKAQEHTAQVFFALDMPILTLCATCHRTLSREYPATEWRGRVTDAAIFLRQQQEREERAGALLTPPVLYHADGEPVSATRPLCVAVHDPCHLRLEAQAGRALRQALAVCPWVRRVELSDFGACCGGGGVSSLKNPELADKLGKLRAEAVLESGADVVLAQCPGCVLQLNNHLSRQHDRVRARHALEVL